MKRRIFLKNLGLTGATITILPSHVISRLGHIAPSDKLNIAGVGIGGKGKVNLKNMVGQNITALCDCDHEYAENVFKTYSNAVR